jgi:hypothetical protein
MKVYTVETKDTIFWSERKMDATYKHVEFLYGQAKFGEINKADLLKKGKKVIQIQLEDGNKHA